MIKIMPKKANMYSSTAHVFVKFFSIENKHFEERCVGEFSTLDSYVRRAVNVKDIPGRLWIRPAKVPWPKSMGENTPNGAPDRTVWHALIPRNSVRHGYTVNESMKLLVQWLKQTGLPLRVAIMNDGIEEFSVPGIAVYDIDRDDAVKVFKNYLEPWDVEVYCAANAYADNT